MKADRFIQRHRPIERILRPFEDFAHGAASGGILLMSCAVVAMIWANSPWADSYFHLWEIEISLGIADWRLSESLHHWINDGLMAIFFLLVGLEIKREMLVGELATPAKASIPIAAAAGGMLAPALIYVFFNVGQESLRGWGIPMATDIAFALGVLALLGDRVPLALKIFLTALAIADDLGAVLVIALFYTSEISWGYLAAGGVFLALLILCNRLGVRAPLAFALLGAGLWFVFFKSGVHATVAGVLLAMTIPSRAIIDLPEFLRRGRNLLQDFEKGGTGIHIYNDRRQGIVQALKTACQKVETPLQRFEHELHGWVTFFILPLFALSNAGVTLSGSPIELFSSPVALGIIAGLCLGKPIGIVLFTWLTVRSGLGALPSGVGWSHIFGVSILGGVGFTMSLFIANLAFNGSPALDISKIGILSASLLAGISGWLVLAGIQRRS